MYVGSPGRNAIYLLLLLDLGNIMEKEVFRNILTLSKERYLLYYLKSMNGLTFILRVIKNNVLHIFLLLSETASQEKKKRFKFKSASYL